MKLMKQNKKGKNLLRHLHRRNFFFINYILFYVTKCLRSKKKKKSLNGPILTTPPNIYGPPNIDIALQIDMALQIYMVLQI